MTTPPTKHVQANHTYKYLSITNMMLLWDGQPELTVTSPVCTDKLLQVLLFHTFYYKCKFPASTSVATSSNFQYRHMPLLRS